MSRRVIVQASVVGTAYMHFREQYGYSPSFWAFITRKAEFKITRCIINKRICYGMDEEASILLTLVAGSHYKTIFKVMEINGHNPMSIEPVDEEKPQTN